MNPAFTARFEGHSPLPPKPEFVAGLAAPPVRQYHFRFHATDATPDGAPMSIFSPLNTLARLAGPAPFALLVACLAVANPLAAAGNPTAVIHTSKGDIELELFAEQAPRSVENFIGYANNGFYDGTIFHRVISHFMIQGGGFTPDMEKKPTGEPIPNEADNGLSNKRGTIAMARTNDPHSATAQFFINVQDNMNLDYTGQTSSAAWGYAVFGRVTSGMEVVDDIRFVQTSQAGPYSDVPVEPVVIDGVEIKQD
jgi:cyclophilin family peptidyl-prolyl cis-trans isomerase